MGHRGSAIIATSSGFRQIVCGIGGRQWSAAHAQERRSVVIAKTYGVETRVLVIRVVAGLRNPEDKAKHLHFLNHLESVRVLFYYLLILI